MAGELLGAFLGLIVIWMVLAFMIAIAPLLIAHALYRQGRAQIKMAAAFYRQAQALEGLAHALEGSDGEKSVAESLAAIAGAANVDDGRGIR